MPMKLPNRVRRSWRSFLKFAGRKTTGEANLPQTQPKELHSEPEVLPAPPSPWQTAAAELIHEILSYLDMQELKVSVLVCQLWCACGSLRLFQDITVGRRQVFPPYTQPATITMDERLSRNFISLVVAPNSHLTSIHTLSFCCVVNLRYLQWIVQNIPTLRVLYLDHAILSDDVSIPLDKPRTSPIPVDRRTSLDLLSIDDLNDNVRDPAPGLWYLLMTFSAIKVLSISATDPRPISMTMDPDGAACIYTGPKVRVLYLSISGTLCTLASEQLHHAIEFRDILKLQINPFMAYSEADHLARFLETHKRSLHIVELSVRCSWGFDPCLFDMWSLRIHPTYRSRGLPASKEVLLQTSDSCLEELRNVLTTSCPYLCKFTLAYLAPLSISDQPRFDYLVAAWNSHVKVFLQGVPTLEDITLDLCCQVESTGRGNVPHDLSFLPIHFLERLNWSIVDDFLKDDSQRSDEDPPKRLTFAFNNRELAKKSLWWFYVLGKDVSQPAPPGWQDVVKSKLSYPAREAVSWI